MKRVLLLVALASVMATMVIVSALPAIAAPGGNAVNAAKCKEGGYLDYTDASGNPFKNEGQCTRYAAKGGQLVPVPTPDISLNMTDAVSGTISGTGFTPNSPITLTLVYLPEGLTFVEGPFPTDATGAFVAPPESEGPFFFCFNPPDTPTSIEVTATDGEGVAVTESFPLNCGM
jgi:hypothetical protein